MPNTNSDVNAALAAYLAATDLNRPELEYDLIKSLETYARKIVWLTLRESRPEIVNEAVQSVVAHLKDFKGNSRFSTYFYSIVERLCFSELRRKINSKEKLFSDFNEHQLDGLASYQLDGDAKITLNRIRTTLSEQENDLIDRKLQGYTHAEIAQLMATTTSAVESRWSRLREKVRQTETNNTRPSRTKTPT